MSVDKQSEAELSVGWVESDNPYYKLGLSWAKLSCKLGFGCTVITFVAVYQFI